MNCKQAEQFLALWVGGDLDEASIREVEEHLALCSGCRATGRKLKTSQQALVRAGEAGPIRPASDAQAASPTSIWPGVSRGLRALEARKRKQRFNGWVPAAAVLAACLAIMITPRQQSEDQAHPIAPPQSGWNRSVDFQRGTSGANPISSAGKVFTDFQTPYTENKGNADRDRQKNSKSIEHPFFSIPMSPSHD